MALMHCFYEVFHVEHTQVPNRKLLIEMYILPAKRQANGVNFLLFIHRRVVNHILRYISQHAIVCNTKGP
jgi:hypothetical protein